MSITSSQWILKLNVYLTILLVCGSLLILGSDTKGQSFLDGYRVEYRYQAYEQITPDTLFWANELWFDSSYHNQYFPYTLNPAVFKFPWGMSMCTIGIMK
jgi:hypothetical protein